MKLIKIGDCRQITDTWQGHRSRNALLRRTVKHIDGIHMIRAEKDDILTHVQVYSADGTWNSHGFRPPNEEEEKIFRERLARRQERIRKEAEAEERYLAENRRREIERKNNRWWRRLVRFIFRLPQKIPAAHLLKESNEN